MLKSMEEERVVLLSFHGHNFPDIYFDLLLFTLWCYQFSKLAFLAHAGVPDLPKEQINTK